DTYCSVTYTLSLHDALPILLVALIGGVAAVVVSLRAGALAGVLKNTLLIVTSFGRGRWAEFRQRSDMNQPGALRLAYGAVIALRSEEHTSELQSLAYLVCRL